MRAAARQGDGRAVPPAPRQSRKRPAARDVRSGHRACPTAPISAAPPSGCSPNCRRARSAVLYFIDLDRFKTVNDTMGHAIRRHAARHGRQSPARSGATASLPRGAIRTPLIGRLAGDEFTMFFPELRNLRDAERIGARRAVRALASRSTSPTRRSRSAPRSAWRCAPSTATTLHDLMRAADAAMYHAKAHGPRPRRAFHRMRSRRRSPSARSSRATCASAIDKDQFTLVFQPQVSAADGRIVAAEALLRWRHPDGLKLPGASSSVPRRRG